MTNWHNEFQKELDGEDVCDLEALIDELGCRESVNEALTKREEARGAFKR